MRVVIIAALPGELKPLIKGWRAVRAGQRGTKMWVLANGTDTWVAVCAGMGADAARRAYAAAAADGPLDMLLSVGWAGALEAGMSPGTAYVLTDVIDAQTGEQFGQAWGSRRRLVTTVRVADAAEKSRLAATYSGAALVDMEGATVARLGAMHSIPVICIKGISDAADATLPDLNRFVDAMGQMRMPAFLAYVALRPRYWTSLLHLGRNSARAAEAMRDLIQKFMEEKNVEELIATGSI